MTMSAPWTRVNFGGANQPQGPGERSRTMIIIGADYHPGFQQIAFVDTDSGEFQERRLEHREEAEEFYRDLKARGTSVRRDLLELLDRLTSTIAELTQAVEQ